MTWFSLGSFYPLSNHTPPCRIPAGVCAPESEAAIATSSLGWARLLRYLAPIATALHKLIHIYPSHLTFGDQNHEL
jgi:hypothetical protein